MSVDWIKVFTIVHSTSHTHTSNVYNPAKALCAPHFRIVCAAQLDVTQQLIICLILDFKVLDLDPLHGHKKLSSTNASSCLIMFQLDFEVLDFRSSFHRHKRKIF